MCILSSSMKSKGKKQQNSFSLHPQDEAAEKIYLKFRKFTLGSPSSEHSYPPNSYHSLQKLLHLEIQLPRVRMATAENFLFSFVRVKYNIQRWRIIIISPSPSPGSLHLPDLLHPRFHTLRMPCFCPAHVQRRRC